MLSQDVSTVTPRQMVEALLIDPKLVRQDMKMLLCKDRVNKEKRDALFDSIARLTEICNVKSVILVGVGKLDSALISYAVFSVYYLDILVGFESIQR